jgi:serine/threonine protein kinase
MENGSLEMWLRNCADAIGGLGWPDCMKICLSSASGLSFLHDGFVPHFIHRDMKSSEILSVRDSSHVSTDMAGTFG